jgi:hypothetical protein
MEDKFYEDCLLLEELLSMAEEKLLCYNEKAE